MINIIELRIGNFCYADKKLKESVLAKEPSKLSALDKIRAQYAGAKDKSFYQVDSINKSNVIELSNPFNQEILTVRFEDIYPIELTSELLHNCGFKNKTFTSKDLIEKYLTVEGVVPIRISEYKQKNHFSIYVFDKQTESNTFLRHINYLHQLQNLYLDLYGKKLEINLNFRGSPALI